MEALERIYARMRGTPEVVVPLSWGALSGGLAAAHSYASIFHGSTPRARVFRSVDPGVVVFVASASLGYFVDRRTPEQQAPESPS